MKELSTTSWEIVWSAVPVLSTYRGYDSNNLGLTEQVVRWRNSPKEGCITCISVL